MNDTAKEVCAKRKNISQNANTALRRKIYICIIWFLQASIYVKESNFLCRMFILIKVCRKKKKKKKNENKRTTEYF